MFNKFLYTTFVMVVVIIASGAIYLSHVPFSRITDTLAGIFFMPSITKQDLLALYGRNTAGTTPETPKESPPPSPISLPSIALPQTSSASASSAQKLRILVVPGHDNDSWGTQYKDTKEADLTLALANDLTSYLSQDPAFDVIQARTNSGYMPELVAYFQDEKDGIAKFRDDYAAQMDSLMKAGMVSTNQTMDHHTVSSDVVTKLYGINKWANEHSIDLVINIHFNDYPHSDTSSPGKYSGFTIYVPEHQYSNAAASKSVAEKVLARLQQFDPASDLPNESSGIVEDQTLIALGSFNTLDPASFLAEYSYIYEPQIANIDVRPLAIKELAYETYLGVMDFFKQRTADYPQAGIFPYSWNTDLKEGTKGSPDVFALQTALHMDGYYPPAGRNLNDCPINGNFGLCTQMAVEAYQANRNISPASGYVGSLTRASLNGVYGGTRVSEAR